MNITGRFLKVWEVKEIYGTKFVNLGDSKKQKDGSYENWTWFDCLFVGKAKDKQIEKGDIIDVKGGIIYQKKSDSGKYYTNIVIFEFEKTGTFEVMKKASEKIKNDPEALGETNDLPF